MGTGTKPNTEDLVQDVLGLVTEYQDILYTILYALDDSGADKLGAKIIRKMDSVQDYIVYNADTYSDDDISYVRDIFRGISPIIKALKSIKKDTARAIKMSDNVLK